MARKGRLFRRMPAQPNKEVMTAATAANVDSKYRTLVMFDGIEGETGIRISSGRFATRRTSAFSHTLNQANRQKTSPSNEYPES